MSDKDREEKLIKAILDLSLVIKELVSRVDRLDVWINSMELYISSYNKEHREDAH